MWRNSPQSMFHHRHRRLRQEHGFASLDMRNTRQTKTEIVFDWTNSGSTVTEQTKTSNRFSSSYKGVLDAQVLSVSGNIGSGNGSVEASNYHEEYSSKSTQTLKVDAYRGTTSWKGGTAFFESYKATDESKSQWSTEQTGHWTSNSRVNTSVGGVYTTSKFDALGDSGYRAESDSLEKSVTNWQRSFDGQSYGTDVNTLFESTDTTSTTSDHTDYDYTYTTKTWNSSWLISQYSEGWGYHPQTDTDTSDLTETTETNDGFSPQYLMGSVLGLMTITPVTGWNPSTATTFIYSTPTLSVSGASDAASLVLPELVMTTTDFGAYGTVADTRTVWQKLKDSIVQAGQEFLDEALQTAVWISGKLDSLSFASGLPHGDEDDTNNGMTNLGDNSDWLDWAANTFGLRITYVTKFLGGVVQDTTGDEFLLTTSGGGLVGYTVGGSVIVGVTSYFIAAPACASWSALATYGAVSATVEYLAIHGLGNLINPDHNNATIEGAIKTAATGAIMNAAVGKLFQRILGGCFVAGTEVTVTSAPGSGRDRRKLLPAPTEFEDLRLSSTSFEHFTSSTSSTATMSRTRIPIEDVVLGSRVSTANPKPWEHDFSLPEPDQDTWLQIDMIAHRDDGGVVEVQLLRPRDLVESTGVIVGATLPFEVPELQVSGTAHVTKISPAPAISSGDGHAVTGRYVTRRVDEIARVEMQDETGRVAVLEGTPIHPIWSADRHDWVPLGELEAGELLQGENGLLPVLSVEIQARSVRVYNLEIHGEHVYEVGEFGVLVRNSGECTKPFWKLFEEIREKAFGEKVVRGTGGKGVDLVLENGTMVELKAWSHLVWERLSGSARNQNMLDRLDEQLRSFLFNNCAFCAHHFVLSRDWTAGSRVMLMVDREDG